jgi:hypothetical protein
MFAWMRRFFESVSNGRVRDVHIEYRPLRDAREVLREIVRASNLRWDDSDTLIYDAQVNLMRFMRAAIATPSEMSPVIYLPGGSGVVRVVISRDGDLLVVRHVDFVPKGALSSFNVRLFNQ